MKTNTHHPAPVAKLPEPRTCFIDPREYADYRFTVAGYQLNPRKERVPAAVIPVTRPPSKAKLKAIQRLLETEDFDLRLKLGDAVDDAKNLTMSKRGPAASHIVESVMRCLGLSTARRGGMGGKAK